MPGKKVSNNALQKSDIDNKTYALEEYKTLRNEIMQNTQDNIKILQFGLTIAASLLSFAYLETVRDSGVRWLYFFVISVILAPIVMLHAQRIRGSAKISFYIQKRIEPVLNIHWETFSMWARLNLTQPEKRLTIRFASAVTIPLMFIQLISPVFSAIDLLWLPALNHPDVEIYEIVIWGILTIVTLILLIIEIRMTNEANHPKTQAKIWDEQLGDIEKSLLKVSSLGDQGSE